MRGRDSLLDAGAIVTIEAVLMARSEVEECLGKVEECLGIHATAAVILGTENKLGEDWEQHKSKPAI